MIAWSRSATSISVTASRDADVLEAAAGPRQVTDAIRTPDVLLDGLARLRLGAELPRSGTACGSPTCDLGDGAPVVMVHGEPTWSYLWRKVAVPVRDAGFRVILPDLPGFGRSDKPMDEHWYSYERHTAALASLIEALDLRDATFVLHDWGGPIGLRVAVEHPERVSRLVLMDTGIFTGEQQHERRLAPLRRLRRTRRRAPGLPAGPPRLRHRPGRRGRRRLRRPVPERGVQGGRARLPGDPALCRPPTWARAPATTSCARSAPTPARR